MRSFFSTIHLLVIVIFTCHFSVAEAKDSVSSVSVSNSSGKLIFSKYGIKIETDGIAPGSDSQSEAVWSLKIQNLSDNNSEIVFSERDNKPNISSSEHGFVLSYNDLIFNGKRWDIDLSLFFSNQGEAFSVKGEIKNNVQGWAVVGFTGPVISGIKAELAEYPLIMPCGLGQKFTMAPSSKDSINKVSFKGGLAWTYDRANSAFILKSDYPSRFATMQWCAFAGDKGGLYYGSHDKRHGSKHFKVLYKPSNNTLGVAFEHDLVCAPGSKWQIPEQIIYPYKGSWHKGADLYREWFKTSVGFQQVPEWLKSSSGWMLTIMKQQNNEVMWNYADLSGLADISLERGLDIIGLFGWTKGGHDKFYPYYEPDPDMGGKEVLIKVLKEIKQKGVRSIIYANGQLIDQNGTDYWEREGKRISVLKKNGNVDYQKWHKYYDAPARFHGMACLGCNEWYDIMLNLALQANELGADGILYDQLAVTAPKFCYSPNHGHAVPAVVYAEDRYLFLRKISEYMKTINKDFVVMTEGLNDVEMESVSMFHGYENGAYVPLIEEFAARLNGSAPTYIFPEMFKYTFPEMITTTRNPAPVNNRLILNYATLYGLRSELETRYAADVRYLKENRIPVPEDYSNVISKPNIDLVTSEDPVAMKIYTKEVIDFQRENSGLLWRGVYNDDKDFSIKCNANTVIAKSFISANRVGIVVWNTGKEKESFEVNVPGYILEYATEPGKGTINVSEKLSAESIRLLVWKKDNK
ncbi:MAG: DUF6259 domain-containing protein [Rikenellaceae bacterium]|nr:DUF6259 domain-containing protein [Rikenellaceae bacterium]